MTEYHQIFYFLIIRMLILDLCHSRITEWLTYDKDIYEEKLTSDVYHSVTLSHMSYFTSYRCCI